MIKDAALTEEQLGIAEKVQKLLTLAAKNTNQEEAASATAKAMELLAAYNLDMAVVEQNAGGKGKRTDEKLKGGLYRFQRDLWRAVAQLNFCLYWTSYEYVPDKTRKIFRREEEYSSNKGWHMKRKQVGTGKGGYEFRHRLVGRVHNVKATIAMAQYLEQTIERITRDRLNGDGSQFFTKWAVSYREGISDEVVRKVMERRQEILDEDARKAHEAAMAAKAAGGTAGTSLTIAGLAQSEEDANNDHIHGEGWSARQREERARRAAARKAAEEEYARWAAANPEEAKKAEEKRRKEAREYKPRRSYSGSTWKGDSSAYWAGKDAGKKVSIDPQADRTRTAGALG